MSAQEARARPFLADGALLFITAVWGATFVTVKDALSEADPLTFLALRFSVGAVVAALLARGALRQREAWRAGVVLGVLLFVGYALQTFGLEYTTPSRSAFITGLSVVFVPLVALALFRRPPHVAAVGGAVLAGVGLAVMTGFELSGVQWLGDGLTLGCAVVYSFHIALTGKYAPEVASPTALVTVQLLVTAVLSAIAMPLGPMRLNLTSGFVGAVLTTGVVASAFAISIQAWAQARTSAVRAAVIFALEPVFAAALSAALGREQLTARQVGGGALILAGVLTGEIGFALRGAHERRDPLH